MGASSQEMLGTGGTHVRGERGHFSRSMACIEVGEVAAKQPFRWYGQQRVVRCDVEDWGRAGLVAMGDLHRMMFQFISLF
jgi:hypothetical protein